MIDWESASRHRGLFVLLLALVCGVGGCGSGKGTVSGKVSFGGKLLAGGSVAFTGPDNMVATSTIDPDGTYRIANASAGLNKIAVTVQPAAPIAGEKAMDASKFGSDSGGKSKPGADSLKPAAIPKKYSDPAQSGLTLEVKSGSQNHDIKLE